MFKDIIKKLLTKRKVENVYLGNFVFEEITEQEYEMISKDKDIIPILLKMKKNDILLHMDELRFNNSDEVRWFINWLYSDYNRMFYKNFTIKK